MKTKMNRKALQAKLNHTLSDYVKSVTNADSKKISKSIKKASKIVAKAVTKEINASEASNPFKEKPVARKRIVKKQTKVKAIKRLSLPRVVHKVNKVAPVKVSQKKYEIPVIQDGEDKARKEI
jgi:hypothetical protein